MHGIDKATPQHPLPALGIAHDIDAGMRKMRAQRVQGRQHQQAITQGSGADHEDSLLQRSLYRHTIPQIVTQAKGTSLPHSQTIHFVDVAPMGPLPELLTYALPPEWQGLARPGMRALVPLGRRVVTGCIVALQETPPVNDPKFVVDLLDDEPTLTPDLLALTQWMASYYVATWGETIRAALPRALQSGSVQTIMLTPQGRSTTARETRTALESRILTALTQHRSLTLRQLQRQIAAPGLRHAIQRLAAAGVVEVSQKLTAPRFHAPTEDLFQLARSAEEIKSAIQAMERRAPRQAALLRHLLPTGAATTAELRQHVSS